MSAIKDKFHNNMTVKLRCGGVIEGVSYMLDNTLEYCPANGYEVIEWYMDTGRFDERNVDHPLDIVEVLSEKPKPPEPKTLKSIIGMGGLCAGMKFKHCLRGLATVHDVKGVAFLSLDDSPDYLVRWRSVTQPENWILVGGD